MQQHHKKHPHLERLRKTARRVDVNGSSRILILSDLHMGNGGRRDEFRRNAGLVETVLSDYYQPQGFSLLLNGDVEELFKFPLEDIVTRWESMYRLFMSFSENGFFLRTFGNHDASLQDEQGYILAPYLLEAVRLVYGREEMLVFHGHQASIFLWETYPLVSRLIALFLRYVAKPFGIRNFSMAYNSRRRFAIEKSIYEFSNQEKIVSVIGHTHRPLFESLSKVDYLNYRIEELCRAYPDAALPEREYIESRIATMKEELSDCYRQGKRIGLRSGVYNNLTIPSVFNSGCAIGKRGITALEIDREKVRLVYWYNGRQSRKYPSDRDSTPMPLGQTGYSRVILNEDRLDYVFSRLHLLA
ncbi:metallophosphoesterase [Prosthecochloris vibrioformis]|uniref:Metallophosphoesterase n=1 Tax=Prosthecochloris vibrioformis TaxID=1098 RepID=A0A5C4RZJ2_PROVB|nr:metallophosphoesterase [Prosthecochloris vibrioformis]TNJ36091.1 metallophosphoesterase [Prosthecochloris vibrioformis]